jgi:hypothetical protein
VYQLTRTNRVLAFWTAPGTRRSIQNDKVLWLRWQINATSSGGARARALAISTHITCPDVPTAGTRRCVAGTVAQSGRKRFPTASILHQRQYLKITYSGDPGRLRWVGGNLQFNRWRCCALSFRGRKKLLYLLIIR